MFAGFGLIFAVVRLVVKLLLVLLLVFAPALAEAKAKRTPAPIARGKKGVVASADREASRAGIQILEAGGNAIDAAIATAYALSVVEPFSAGIGGGGFLLYYDAKTKKTTVVDYREVAPKKAYRDMYLVNGKPDAELSTVGIKAVAIPGMVPGLDAAQKKFGKKKLRDVVQPAIALAEKGFLISPHYFGACVSDLDVLRSNPAAAAHFLVDGECPPIGVRFKQPELARTLKDLAREGSRLFTHGRIAQAIAKESARLGGLVELSDLQKFAPRFREPLTGEYRGHTILTMPPPSSGGTHLLQMLAMWDLDRVSHEEPRRLNTHHVHVLAEIMRRAYADRATYMGDPAFVKVPIEGLLSKAYLTERFGTIDPMRATPSSAIAAGMVAAKESKETTHLTVIDAAGNVVALTQTVNTGYGSGVVVPGTGVLLNNEMDDFSAAPGTPNSFGLVGGESNSIQPGKIPLSSMTPTIVLKDGKVRLALGSPGGATIITTVLQIIINVIDRGMDVASAVSEPRIHMQWLPDELRHELGAISDDMARELTASGHKLVVRESWGNATAIEILADGTRVGAADPRGDGACDAQ